jgi:pimeloyl-ACP methyl ester carboxylesterase
MDTLPDIGQIEHIDIDGLRIRLARSGQSDGIPILLTSPWPESLYAFRDAAPALAGLGPVIAVDLPGFGRSEGRPDLIAPEAMGHFLIGLIETLGFSRVHAVGPDVGTLALLFAAHHRPDLFESLVGGSGATDAGLAGPDLRAIINSPPGYFEALNGGDIAVSFVTESAVHPTPPAVLEDYRLSSAGRRFEDAAKFVRAYPQELPRLQTLLATIETPVLVLAGRHDQGVPPPNGQLLADRLPHCRYVLLEGGHLIWEDAAEAYAQSVATWIAGDYRTV